MIIFVSDNVVSCTASIVHRHMLATCLSGHPNFLLSCVLVISWSFLDHLIKKTLKRSLPHRRIITDVISWILWEAFGLNLRAASIKPCIESESLCISMLGCPVWHLAVWNEATIIFTCFCADSVTTISIDAARLHCKLCVQG